MPRQNRRERFCITPWALARRAAGRMPESTAAMRESGVQMAMLKKPWKAFSTAGQTPAGQVIDNHPQAANNTRLFGPGSPP